jgi:acylphosphatase
MKVEVITTGCKANLDKFCDKCQSGPTLAEVASVNIKAINLKEFSSFKIIY